MFCLDSRVNVIHYNQKSRDGNEPCVRGPVAVLNVSYLSKQTVHVATILDEEVTQIFA